MKMKTEKDSDYCICTECIDKALAKLNGREVPE